MSQTQSRTSSGQHRRRREEEEEVWIPKTSIGKRVLAGEINSMEEILLLYKYRMKIHRFKLSTQN